MSSSSRAARGASRDQASRYQPMQQQAPQAEPPSRADLLAGVGGASGYFANPSTYPQPSSSPDLLSGITAQSQQHIYPPGVPGSPSAVRSVSAYQSYGAPASGQYQPTQPPSQPQLQSSNAGPGYNAAEISPPYGYTPPQQQEAPYYRPAEPGLYYPPPLQQLVPRPNYQTPSTASAQRNSGRTYPGDTEGDRYYQANPRRPQYRREPR